MEVVDMDTREIKQLVDIFCQRVLTNKTTYISLDYRNNVVKYFLNNASTTHNVQQHQIDSNPQQPPPLYTSGTQQLSTLEAVEMNIREIKQLVDFFCCRVLTNKPTYILLNYRNLELKYFVQLQRIDGKPQQRPPHYKPRIGTKHLTNTITYIAGYE